LDTAAPVVGTIKSGRETRKKAETSLWEAKATSYQFMPPSEKVRTASPLQNKGRVGRRTTKVSINSVYSKPRLYDVNFNLLKPRGMFEMLPFPAPLLHEFGNA
jgi:hypothetical protein